MLYRTFMFFREYRGMDIVAAARALNQRAAKENWHHFCDPTLAFADSTYTHLLDLWRAKAGDRKMPKRSDMTPRDLKDVLRNLLVLERISQEPSRYRFRLVGTGLTGMGTGGVDPTGKMIEEGLPAEALERWIECGDMILDGGQPLRFLGRVHLAGRDYLDAENLFVPLANDNDVPTFVMGFCRYTPRQTDSEDSWENQIASIPGGLL
jgi:hypothetical protein